MHRNTLPASTMTRADAEAIVAGFLSTRRAKHGDATMHGPPGGEGGGDDGGDDGGAGGDNAGGAGGGDSGPVTDPNDPNYFPPHTAVAEMTDRQQAAYWRNMSKTVQARVPKDLDDLRRKASEYDDLVASTRTEAEVAIDEALEIGREEGRAEVRLQAAAEILRAQLSVGRTEDQVEVLMRGLNPAGFVSEDGSAIDVAAITAFAATLGGGASGETVDLGQGRRGGGSKPSVASGRDLYEQTHQKKTPAAV